LRREKEQLTYASPFIDPPQKKSQLLQNMSSATSFSAAHATNGAPSV